MGCCASAPKAAEFLTDEQPAPPNGYLHDGMPAEGLTVPVWSNKHDDMYHKGTRGAIENDTVTYAYGDGWVTIKTCLGNEGDTSDGQPETLPIAVSGAQIATLSMPPHMAFGIAAVLRDSKGGVIAVVATAQKERPSGSNSTTINIWGTKSIPGAAPANVGGITGLYLWGKAERKGGSASLWGSNIFTISRAASGGAMSVFAKGSPINGFQYWQYKFETPGGQGLMLATFTPGTKRTLEKVFDIQCAKGVDAAFAICMMAAMQLGKDELIVEARNAGGPGSGGDLPT